MFQRVFAFRRLPSSIRSRVAGPVMVILLLPSGSVRANAVAVPSGSRSGEPEFTEPRPPPRGPHPTLWWAITQLVPSPEVAVGSGEANFGLRWQLTPLLYSWGVNRKVSGWRSLVVEPNVRHAGSVEFFVSPEVVFTRENLFWVRPGLRAYFPLAHHGEYLSTSVGLSYQRVEGADAVAVEVGAYVLFGTLGLLVSHAPGPASPLQSIVTLRIRYF